MIDPNELLAAWVATLSAVPELVEVLTAGRIGISSYHDGMSDGGLKTAVYGMAAGTVMVAWNGMGPVRGGSGGAIYFQHDFSLFLRASEKVDYGRLCWLLAEGVPQVHANTGAIKLLHWPIHPACEAMDVDLPRAQRNVLSIGDGSITVDYFEFRAGLRERSDTR